MEGEGRCCENVVEKTKGMDKMDDRYSSLISWWFFFISVTGLSFSGCGKSLLLTQEELKIFSYSKDANTIVYYNEEYIIDDKGKMRIITHSILCAGENARSIPDYFAVYDGSILKLASFEGRVLHANGSQEIYSKSGLSTFALSSASEISESSVLYLPVEKGISPGDLIEKVEVHNQTLPELGIDFSLSSLKARARNITCKINLPAGKKFNYKLLHDSLVPIITTGDGRNQYLFHWNYYVPHNKSNEFDPIHPASKLLAAVVNDTIPSMPWIEFGDWYLTLINDRAVPSEAVTALAQSIIVGRKTNLEKLDAIFEYCKKNIRYEQVYLPLGEFIPNPAPLIFARKYGDCKDYAAIIHTLSRCVGIPTNLALCYRGRGKEFCADIPVSQFNHMIVYYSENGNNFWYDGTNRTGLPGITTIDLINAEALVLERGNSRIIRIEESDQNRMDIRGTMSIENNSLKGNISLVFTSQYAVDLYYHEFYLNRAKMIESLMKWVKMHLNDRISISNLSWRTDTGQFILNIDCELPNTVIHAGSQIYIGIDKTFPKLLPESDPSQDYVSLYYYPTYGRIIIDILFPLMRLGNEVDDFHLKGKIDLPPGPFLSDAQKREFLKQYRDVTGSFHQKFKLTKKE